MPNKYYMQNSDFFNKIGKRRPVVYVNKARVEIERENPAAKDTENRSKILREIEERCNNGETLDVVVAEIANREEVKTQFDYFAKNGIVDLTTIFRNWYESYARNKDRNNKLRGTR